MPSVLKATLRTATVPSVSVKGSDTPSVILLNGAHLLRGTTSFDRPPHLQRDHAQQSMYAPSIFSLRTAVTPGRTLRPRRSRERRRETLAPSAPSSSLPLLPTPRPPRRRRRAKPGRDRRRRAPSLLLAWRRATRDAAVQRGHGARRAAWRWLCAWPCRWRGRVADTRWLRCGRRARGSGVAARIWQSGVLGWRGALGWSWRLARRRGAGRGCRGQAGFQGPAGFRHGRPRHG